MTKTRSLLIIDDDVDTLKILQHDLKELQCDIVTTQDGKEALYQLAVKKFDCILCDVNMPFMDGISLADHLRQEQDDTPFIFFTAVKPENSRVINQLQFQAPYDIVHKPYDKEKLIAIIQDAFKKP